MEKINQSIDVNNEQKEESVAHFNLPGMMQILDLLENPKVDDALIRKLRSTANSYKHNIGPEEEYQKILERIDNLNSKI